MFLQLNLAYLFWRLWAIFPVITFKNLCHVIWNVCITHLTISKHTPCRSLLIRLVPLSLLAQLPLTGCQLSPLGTCWYLGIALNFKVSFLTVRKWQWQQRTYFRCVNINYVMVYASLTYLHFWLVSRIRYELHLGNGYLFKNLDTLKLLFESIYNNMSLFIYRLMKSASR